MTPRKWQISADPLAMLAELYPVRGVDSVGPQSRRSRLYLLACARRAWEQLPGVCRVVASLAERVYAGRECNRTLHQEVYPHAEALVNCRGEAEDVNAIGRSLVSLGHATTAQVWATEDCHPELWTGFAYLIYAPFYRTTPQFRSIPPSLHSAELLREIFGNPLVPQPPFRSEWRTDTVVRLAQHVETTLDFSVLPILADAFEEAGCDRADVLHHLRHGGPHARGCWVLEGILATR